MARRASLTQHQRQQHQATLLADLAQETQLKGQLSAQLPPKVWSRMSAKLETMTYPADRVGFLLMAAGRTQAYTEIVEEADRILLVGIDRVDVYGQGHVYKRVPAKWEVVAHLALSAGWTQIGASRLERNGAGRAANTPAPLVPEGTLPQEQDTTDQAPRQIDLVVLYEVDDASVFSRIHSDGKLMECQADGQPMEPPAFSLGEVYRWLQDRGYVPDLARFGWLDKGQGRRRRRQVYVLAI
jgi:hypothetical protein